MKSFPKIKIIFLLTGKHNNKSIYWCVLTLLVAMTLSDCKKDMNPDNSFPVNETFAMELISKGIPADIAQFFAAAKMETSTPDDRTCIYLQTFPNGASREMTLRDHFLFNKDQRASTLPIILLHPHPWLVRCGSLLSLAIWALGFSIL